MQYRYILFNKLDLFCLTNKITIKTYDVNRTSITHVDKVITKKYKIYCKFSKKQLRLSCV